MLPLPALFYLSLFPISFLEYKADQVMSQAFLIIFPFGFLPLNCIHLEAINDFLGL